MGALSFKPEEARFSITKPRSNDDDAILAIGSSEPGFWRDCSVRLVKRNTQSKLQRFVLKPSAEVGFMHLHISALFQSVLYAPSSIQCQPDQYVAIRCTQFHRHSSDYPGTRWCPMTLQFSHKCRSNWTSVACDQPFDTSLSAVSVKRFRMIFFHHSGGVLARVPSSNELVISVSPLEDELQQLTLATDPFLDADQYPYLWEVDCIGKFFSYAQMRSIGLSSFTFALGLGASVFSIFRSFSSQTINHIPAIASDASGSNPSQIVSRSISSLCGAFPEGAIVCPTCKGLRVFACFFIMSNCPICEGKGYYLCKQCKGLGYFLP